MTEEELPAAEKEQFDREALSDPVNWKRKGSAMDFGGLRFICEFNHNGLRVTAVIIFGCNTVCLIEWNAKDGQKQTSFSLEECGKTMEKIRENFFKLVARKLRRAS